MTTIECNSEEGITIGLVDALIVIMRLLKDRDRSSPTIQEAIKDFVHNSGMWDVLPDYFRVLQPPEEDLIYKYRNLEHHYKLLVEKLDRTKQQCEYPCDCC